MSSSSEKLKVIVTSFPRILEGYSPTETELSKESS
jgi:hypothetical protein